MPAGQAPLRPSRSDRRIPRAASARERSVRERWAMSEPLLSVHGLTKSYRRGARPALAGASFDLAKGEILGVVGESGSGKTTLARCIALLERPDSGRVVFNGEDLTAL